MLNYTNTQLDGYINNVNFSFFDNVPRMKIHTVGTIESCLHEVCS